MGDRRRESEEVVKPFLMYRGERWDMNGGTRDEITFEMPIETGQALRKYATEKQMTASEVLEPLLTEFLERQRYLDPNRHGKA